MSSHLAQKLVSVQIIFLKPGTWFSLQFTDFVYFIWVFIVADQMWVSWIETGKLFGSGGFPQEAGIAFVEQITGAPKATFTLHMLTKTASLSLQLWGFCPRSKDGNI